MDCATTMNDSTGVAARESTGRHTPTHIEADGDLLTALRAGYDTAAETLFRRYGVRAYRLAFGITRRAEDAEEVVQDAFWNVIRKIDTYRGDSAFGSWVYRIVANAAYQRIRSRVRHRDEISLLDVLPSFQDDGRHAEPIADWSVRVSDPARQVELRAALNAAIDDLPATYRALIILREFEGLSVAEAAEILGITVAAVKCRTHRGRLFLRKRLAGFFAGEMQRTTPPSSVARGH